MRTTPAAISCFRSSSRARRVADARGRVDPQGDAAAAALHRRLAARRDGDGRQGGRGRRAARGDEGLRHRHARHARLDHRAARGRGLHRARRPLARGHREGHPGDPAARRAPAHLARADRELGAAAAPHRAGPGHAPGVHGRHREVHHRDRPGARQAQGRPDRARQARPLPDLRTRDQREPQGLLVLVARRPRLRLRDLEEEGGEVAAGVGGEGADLSR